MNRRELIFSADEHMDHATCKTCAAECQKAI